MFYKVKYRPKYLKHSSAWYFFTCHRGAILKVTPEHITHSVGHGSIIAFDPVSKKSMEYPGDETAILIYVEELKQVNFEEDFDDL